MRRHADATPLDEISVDDVATAAGTIGYEMLISLGCLYYRAA